jgi:UBX domain
MELKGVTSTGVAQVAPKVLAQHHCSPPPSKEAMAQWMNELRKRHSKQYAIMQKQVLELQLFKERKEGYRESVQSDVERKIREAKEEAERLAKEKAEKERLEALERRRAEFVKDLPEEPGPKVRDAITLSVRHNDGRSEKRRFAKDTELDVLFNWVDATFKVEREKVILTTMTGKQTFSWEDASEKKNLKEAGLGRMVGFRLLEKVEETKEEEKKEEDKTSKGGES